MKNYKFTRKEVGGVVSATVADCSFAEALTGTLTQNFDAETAYSGVGATVAHLSIAAVGGAIDKKIQTGQWGIPFVE